MNTSHHANRKPPRIPRFVLLRSALVSMSLGGCVPTTAYEQAASTAQVEREGHRMAVAKLEASQAELKRLEKERDALKASAESLESTIQDNEQKLAQANLDVAKSEKAHEQDALLVNQLRGELARVGEHLKTYAGDKDALQAQLDSLQAQLLEKSQRITFLEAQMNGLRTNLATTEANSEKTQQQLDGALSELADLERQVDPQESPSDTPAEEDAKPERPEAEPSGEQKDGEDNAKAPAASDESSDEQGAAGEDDEREDESIYDPPEEVEPSEEAE